MKRSDEEYLFSQMPVARAIAALAVPTVISQVITVVYNMADTLFVGQLGDPVQVAAATIAMPLFMLFTAFSNLFGVGGASLISRCLGAGEREKARRCAAFCIWGAGAVALLYGLSVLALRPVLLPLLGANGDTWAHASDYIFWTVTVGAVPAVLNPELAHLIRAEGHSRQASLGVAFGGVLNILLDPLFIFVFDLNIVGAAIATMLSNLAATLYFLLFLRNIRSTSVVTCSPRALIWNGPMAAEVLAVGLPSFCISLMGTVSNTALNHIISAYSNEAVAGMGIAKKLNLLAFAVAQGITQGTLPLIGYCFTSGDRKRMSRVIRTLAVICAGFALAITALLFFGAAPITRFFIDNSETVACGRQFLRIICLAGPTSMLIFFSMTIFQATRKRRRPLVLSLLRKGSVDVPLMVLFNHLFQLTGVAWATPVADTIAALTALAMILPYIRTLTAPPPAPAKTPETHNWA